MGVVLAITAIVLAALIVSSRRAKTMKHALRTLGEEEFLSARPADIPSADWLRLRTVVARTLEIPPEQLDPTQRIDDLHRKLAFIGISTVDVEYIVEDCCEPDEFERVFARVEREQPSSFGELMAAILRGLGEARM